MERIFLLIIVLVMCLTSTSEAFSSNDNLAVMDFGSRPYATSTEVRTQDLGGATSDHFIHALLKNGFAVVDKDIAIDRLQMSGISTNGIVEPNSAKKIGEILGVRYILYGNVSNVSLSDITVEVEDDSYEGSVTLCTVKAHVIARIMDVQSGNVVMMFKGDGASKSTYVEAGKHGNVIAVGSGRVTLDSVNNAIHKAALEIVGKMSAKCAETKGG